MYKCKICGKEYEKRRSINAHMMKAHMEEYKQAGYKLENVSAEVAGGAGDKVHDLRVLNLNDSAEAEAYRQGYRFIDKDENLYTMEEAKGVL